MRIIKPYGRSHVEIDGGERKRTLRLRSDRKELRDIEEFARSHDELVVAQWISTIDKIAAKPSGRNGPTDEQRKLRESLGNAAWTLIETEGLIPGLKDPEARDRLLKLWQAKIAPYGEARYKARRDRQGRERQPPSPRGRWYDHFTGGVAVEEVDADDVARKIHEHLHVAEHRIGSDGPRRERGRIANRAHSIAVNVPRPGTAAYRGGNRGGWTDADCHAYARAGNVAREIRLAAQRREGGEDGAGTRRVTNNVAGAVLYDHYARLFPGEDGSPLSVADARERWPGLFDLHMAVRDCYTRILKNHGKDQRAHGNDRRRVSDLLPETMEQLFDLVDKKGANRDLNALVRLGKVIHYESSTGGEDRTADPIGDWPADVTGSRFWTSDGQARIKRNESFVRVWRHVLALANRTLTDWADPAGEIPHDILMKESIERATGDLFDLDRCGAKLDLLYGNRAGIFKREGEDEFSRAVLKAALEGVAGLRHGSFHFKGLGGFATALTEAGSADDGDVREAVRTLWDADTADRAMQLRKTMRAAPGTIALPRFGRILRRAVNAWGQEKDGPGLPAPANRMDLEDPARLCQYTALKLLYERPFRTWLEQRNAGSLNGYIDRAAERATQAARDINAREGGEDRALIVARAARLGGLDDDGDVHAFFFNLSAETATEMRVQRGYDSDAEAAREQAGYIEDLKRDVVALAFGDYLRETGFDFLLELAPGMPVPDAPSCDLDAMAAPAGTAGDAEPWQAVLYFLLHLVPVDDVARLLHQMRKWETLAAKADAGVETMAGTVRRVRAVFELYLDMHDAKFEGGSALVGTDPFADLFESRDAFSRVYSPQPGADEDRRIPRRGLREIMRFGHLSPLLPVFEKHRVTDDEVAAFLRAEERPPDGQSEIARLQVRRESLHAKWVADKKLCGDDLRSYVEALSGVIRHRRLGARVTLTDHVRVHRLLVAVMGRLVDYSGLWERDLYFAALAAIHESGCRPEDVLTDKGIRRFGEGRIVDALRNRREGTEARVVEERLRPHFGAVWESGNESVSIRNAFAHFNMLRATTVPDLTACVNDGRDLMAYDRKLKNSVSKSVMELLHREGLTLTWAVEKTGAGHRLGGARLAACQASHLGGKALLHPGEGARGHGRRVKPFAVRENLHGEAFVRMAADLFRGSADDRADVAGLPLDGIDWNRRSNRPGKRGRARKNGSGRGGRSGQKRKNHRRERRNPT